MIEDWLAAAQRVFSFSQTRPFGSRTGCCGWPPPLRSMLSLHFAVGVPRGRLRGSRVLREDAVEQKVDDHGGGADVEPERERPAGQDFVGTGAGVIQVSTDAAGGSGCAPDGRLPVARVGADFDRHARRECPLPCGPATGAGVTGKRLLGKNSLNLGRI
jgi:hypothetical protein